MFTELWKPSIFVRTKKQVRSGKRLKVPRVLLALEWLETRELLSVATPDFIIVSPQHATATTASGVHPDSPPPSLPPGFSPSQIQNAYGFNQIGFASYNGNTLPGAGQTIAIVDAYNDPNIYNDLLTFDSQFGLANPNLTVVNQSGHLISKNGSTSGGVTPPSNNVSWAVEESLDVEWAHAIAPGANIVLVEAASASISNLMLAVTTAGTKVGASVVSMSWGGNEFSGETGYDGSFAASGVTYVASAGDSGSPTGYPATSPNVLSVGGTALTLNSSGGYGSETVWKNSYGSTGGGISAYEALPSYQVAAVTNNSNIPGGIPTNRATPDVAYDADPTTGFAVYDSYGGYGWIEVGGTSDAAPQWAALVAIADQGRAQQGLGSLSGVSQTLPMLYQMPSGYFNDITSGNNGTYSAGTGYDLVTGRGTPIANKVINYLVNGSTSPPPPPTGLVAAYNFAQGSGSVLTDISGNLNNGTISNATWAPVSGSTLPFSSALQFTGGNNSFVTIANSASLDLSTGMTLEAWVDPTAAPKGWQDVMYKYHDNYYLETSSPSGAPAAGGTAGSTDTGPAAQNPLPVNIWSFLAATYNGTDMILYVNGVQVSSVAVSGNLATSTAPLQIGGDSYYGQYFQGLISNVRIYNTALTANEIQEDMNTPIATGTPPPTAPTNLTATASGTSINLNWGTSSDNIGVSYVVDREAPGSSSFVQIATTTGTSYSDGGLAPNSTYTYKVQAVDWAGNQSAFSNTASATTGAGNPTLVAAYNFAQGSGSVLTDFSGNGNNGTISNATWTTVNNSNLPLTGALQFAGGNNSFVTIANSASLDLSTGMTLEAWVDPTAAPKGWQDAMYKYHDNYYLEASSPSGAPAAGGTAGSADTGPYGSSPLPTNTWTFLAATYNGTNMNLYVNGVEVSNVPMSGNLATSTAPLQIGGDSNYGQYFQGLISNVRIYNAALSQSAIQTDMNTPIGSPPAVPSQVRGGTSSSATISLSGSVGASSSTMSRATPSHSAGVQVSLPRNQASQDSLNLGAMTNLFSSSSPQLIDQLFTQAELDAIVSSNSLLSSHFVSPTVTGLRSPLLSDLFAATLVWE
jgi:hypothetical protein